ncbi:MAG: GDSL-type esterase/lipase family protein [Blautia sp.]|nr:GDSL-type esterase/lipase family protein [Blautia sp.]
MSDRVINIMCFGDSNTYGVNPKTGMRYPRNKRWTGILQELLGKDYYVIEEGIGGRTTVWEDPLADNRCGIKALPMLLDSHSPLDLVIVMLGGNDWKHRFGAMPEDTACGVEKLIKLIRSHVYGVGCSVPEILIAAPVPIGEHLEMSPYTGFGMEAVKYSRMLPGFVEKVAERYGCMYINAGDVAYPDEGDQMHLSEISHRNLAIRFFDMIKAHFEGGM